MSDPWAGTPFEGAEVIHSYSRAQAIADGVLVEAPENLCREVGFRVPVAVTQAVYLDCVAWPDTEEPYQNETGRWWDVLFMGALAGRGRNQSRLDYKIVRHAPGTSGVDADEKGPTEVTLSLHIGPGDTGEPVITIMQPHED